MRLAVRPRTLVIAAAIVVALVAAVLVIVLVANAMRPHRAPAVSTPGGGVFGVDASGGVAWASVPANATFAYIEASDRATANRHFAANWNGAGKFGLVRGAYHYGVPSASASDGGAQAKFFYDHGGAQATTGTTLPPVLDVEFDPNGGKGTADPTACWKLSPAQSDAWITAFVREVRALTGRTPAIYTSKTYWQDCLGADRDFSGGALWVVDTTGARTPSLGFGGWSDWSLRQFAIGRQHGAFDYDEFHGSVAALQSFATH